MARAFNKLTALAVSKTNRPGTYSDGAGLNLQIGPTGAKSWLFRYMRNGRAREMGLGPLHTISLAEARSLALGCRKLLQEGQDPIEERKARLAEAKLSAAQAITFRQCAESYIASHKAGWRNEKHVSQWENTLSTYVYPFFGDLSVAQVNTDLVIQCLTPIWTEKTETATRLRGRIESILDWAKTHQYREGENPARWRGHLDNLLPAPQKIAKVEHFAALLYSEVPSFMGLLRKEEGIAAQALEFAILVAGRTAEVIGAQWSEIDSTTGTWTIPAERMKAGKEHRVPLPEGAKKILKTMRSLQQGEFVFPGLREGKPLSNMALLMVLRRMKKTDITAHGFRSSFRDWAAETTAYPREVVEMALAHTIDNKVEAAYRRGDLFEKRRQLMNDWGQYCEPGTTKDKEK